MTAGPPPILYSDFAGPGRDAFCKATEPWRLLRILPMT
jgi:hypothetical protein